MTSAKNVPTAIAMLIILSFLIMATVIPAQTSGQGMVTGTLLKDGGDAYNDAKIYDSEGNVLANVTANGSFSFWIEPGTYTFYARIIAPVVGEISATTLEDIVVTSDNITDVGTVSGIGRPSLSEVTELDEDNPFMYILLGIVVAIVVMIVIVLKKKGKILKKKDTPPPEKPLENQSD